MVKFYINIIIILFISFFLVSLLSKFYQILCLTSIQQISLNKLDFSFYFEVISNDPLCFFEYNFLLLDYTEVLI